MPRTVKTGVPSAGFQRRCSRSIFLAESSKSRPMAGASARALSAASLFRVDSGGR